MFLIPISPFIAQTKVTCSADICLQHVIREEITRLSYFFFCSLRSTLFWRATNQTFTRQWLLNNLKRFINSFSAHWEANINLNSLKVIICIMNEFVCVSPWRWLRSFVCLCARVQSLSPAMAQIGSSHSLWPVTLWHGLQHPHLQRLGWVCLLYVVKWVAVLLRKWRR